MKTNSNIIFLQMLSLMVLGNIIAPFTWAQGVLIPHYLGQTQVSFSDKDQKALKLDKCPPGQLINNLRLRTVKGSVKVDFLKVHYADGQTEILPVKETIQENTDSRWLVLSGSDRCVTNIMIRGTGNNPVRQPIVIKIFGV